VSQVVEFQIEGEPISVSPRDADRLIEALHGSRAIDCASAAEKIERATRPGEDTTVTLAPGEDECVLEMLKQLRATGDFLNPLKRLERALQAKIDRES
jgi:hypothetical protein